MILSPFLGWPLLLALLVPPLAAILWQFRRGAHRGRVAALLRRTLAVLLLGAALLGPAIPGAGTAVTAGRDVDVFIVMDTTTSVLATDYPGGTTRFEVMKEDALELVQAYPGARISLITFDHTPVTRVPLTTDTTAVSSAIEIMDPEYTLYSRGSSVSLASETLSDGLASSQELHPDRRRVVFYLGDGEHTAEKRRDSFAAAAPYIDAGSVYGYGTEEGAPMREFEGRWATEGEEPDFVEDRSEYGDNGYERAISRIDESTLQGIAGELGIAYERRLADTEISIPEIEASTATVVESSDQTVAAQLYWIPALAAVGLLLWEFGVLLSGWLELSRQQRAARTGGAR